MVDYVPNHLIIRIYWCLFELRLFLLRVKRFLAKLQLVLDTVLEEIQLILCSITQLRPKIDFENHYSRQEFHLDLERSIERLFDS